MRHRSHIPLVETKIRLYEGDLARLQDLFPKQGAAGAIRLLVRNFLAKIEASQAPVEISLSDNIVTEILEEAAND